MSQEALDIVRKSAERWNAGDFESMFELYADDLVVVTGEHWPEANVTMEGKDAFRESTQEWLEIWKSVELETHGVQAYGDRVVAHGRYCLRLLPPGSDLVHSRPPHGTWPSTPSTGVLTPKAQPL